MKISALWVTHHYLQSESVSKLLFFSLKKIVNEVLLPSEHLFS